MGIQKRTLSQHDRDMISGNVNQKRTLSQHDRDRISDKVSAFTESMQKLDGTMSNLDQQMDELSRKRPVTTGNKQFSLRYNGHNVYVTYDDGRDIMQIQTTGDVDDALRAEIQFRIDNDYTPVAIGHNTSLAIVFNARTWFGNCGKSLEFGANSEVVVYSGSLFNRKYTVEVDGVTVYMVIIENMLSASGYTSMFLETLPDDTKIIMRKILEGLKTLDIAEEHHLAALDILNK
jgi:hypothetical protein